MAKLFLSPSLRSSPGADLTKLLRRCTASVDCSSSSVSSRTANSTCAAQEIPGRRPLSCRPITSCSRDCHEIYNWPNQTKICCYWLEFRLVASKFLTIVLGGTAASHTCSGVGGGTFF